MTLSGLNDLANRQWGCIYNNLGDYSKHLSKMAEYFGLDDRIANLTGKRKVDFYSWDLECLESVVSGIQDSQKNREIADRIARKIDEGYKYIITKQKILLYD